MIININQKGTRKELDKAQQLDLLHLHRQGAYWDGGGAPGQIEG